MLNNIEIAQRSALAGDSTFGDSGAYQRIKGVASGTLDPAHRRNRTIALLNRAPLTCSRAGGISQRLRPADTG
ncbi:MAG: hypothetical protein ACI8PT_004346 [Gammaproteobacteria bacterium]|jgi:hypothetical protein